MNLIQNKKVLIFLLFFLILGIGLFFYLSTKKKELIFLSPLGSSQKAISEKPLEKYTYENLKKRGGKKSEIKLERVLKEEADFTAYLFSYQLEGRKITGLAHLPKVEGQRPVVVMIRGYVDPQEYETGVGTRPAGEYYARHGYLTLAPDFLGYGESDPPPANIWEERFLRLPSVLDLIASVETLPTADSQKIFLWGHSNGGMIALSVLEISGQSYPTTLWAPVSQYFPYDVLYYTYEAEDKGKALRKALAEFERDYNTDAYSLDEFFDWIKAPILIHQGLADPYIPVSWSDNLVKNLKKHKVSYTYYTYPGADHNLRPAWETVVKRDLEFFGSF